MDKTAQKTCSYYVVHKKRFCKMLVSKNSSYCGQHLVHEENELLNGKKRIPCPLDPKHSIFSSNLTDHLKVCNSREKNYLPYFKKNLNEDKNVIEPCKIILKDLSDTALLNIIAKIEKIHKDFVGNLERLELSHQVLNDALLDPQYGPSVVRHLEQNGSLLGILERQNLLNCEEPTAFVEFGAGKGKLSGWLMRAVEINKKTKYFLVDRGAQRRKMDTKIKYSAFGNLYNITRLRIDILHLSLDDIEELNENDILIGIGKHLCGAATDLSIRCLLNAKKSKIGGCLIALCCHHRCTWSAYSGKKFLENNNFSPNEFPIIKCLTSWAVSGSRKEDESSNAEHQNPDEKNVSETEQLIDKTRYENLNLSVERREHIGRMAKQLLDFGRIMYLRENGFNASLVQYVSSVSTLENVALLAIPR